MTGPLFAAIREALADHAAEHPEETAEHIRTQLADLSPPQLEVCLDALVTVAVVGQRMVNARAGAR